MRSKPLPGATAPSPLQGGNGLAKVSASHLPRPMRERPCTAAVSSSRGRIAGEVNHQGQFPGVQREET
jgi:hypothetical protein